MDNSLPTEAINHTPTETPLVQTGVNMGNNVPVSEHGQPPKKRSKSITAVGIIFLLLGSLPLLMHGYKVFSVFSQRM